MAIVINTSAVNYTVVLMKCSMKYVNYTMQMPADSISPGRK